MKTFADSSPADARCASRSPFAISAAAEQDKPPRCDKRSGYRSRTLRSHLGRLQQKQEIAQVRIGKGSQWLGSPRRPGNPSTPPAMYGLVHELARHSNSGTILVADTAATTDFNGDFNRQDVLYVTENSAGRRGEASSALESEPCCLTARSESFRRISDGQKTWMMSTS